MICPTVTPKLFIKAILNASSALSHSVSLSLLAFATIMTTEVICIKVSQTFTECMQTMTDHNIRHLPVMDGQNVIGLISIGDVVKEILEEQTRTIEQLKSYIVS